MARDWQQNECFQTSVKIKFYILGQSWATRKCWWTRFAWFERCKGRRRTTRATRRTR